MMKQSWRLTMVAAVLVMTVIVLALAPPPQQMQAYISTDAPIGITVNGQWVHFPDQQPVIINDRVFVPVGSVFAAMGFTSYWDAGQGMARLTRSDYTIVIPAGASAFVVNSAVITPEVPQRMINNRIMLPLRAIATAIGGAATWDNVHRVAHLSVPTAGAAAPTPTPTPIQTPTPTPVVPVSAPLTQAAPRFEGSPGFGLGGNAIIFGMAHFNSIWGGGWSHHNLGGNFATLTATIGRFDGSGTAARYIRFTGDGRNLSTFRVEGEHFAPFNVFVDVQGVHILRIEIDEPGYTGANVVAATPVLHSFGAAIHVPQPPTPPPAWPTPTPTPTPLPTPTPTVPPGGATPTPTPMPPTPPPDDRFVIPNRRLTESELAEWIAEYHANGGPNAFELEVLRLLNEERARAGAGPLVMNESIMMAARFKSQSMSDLSYFSHTNPVYGHFTNIPRELFGVGIRGENLASGQRNPAAVVAAWMNSPGHATNMLNPNHTQVGLGFFRYRWTQMFA